MDDKNEMLERGELEELKRALNESGADPEAENSARRALASWYEDHEQPEEAREQREWIRSEE